MIRELLFAKDKKTDSADLQSICITQNTSYLKSRTIKNNYFMEYRTLIKTIKVISEIENEILLNKLLEILKHNEIQKPEKHNRKDDIEVSHFDIDLTEDEINEIIDRLQETQMKFVGDDNEQLFYHYSDLIDSWINLL